MADGRFHGADIVAAIIEGIKIDTVEENQISGGAVAMLIKAIQSLVSGAAYKNKIQLSAFFVPVFLVAVEYLGVVFLQKNKIVGVSFPGDDG